LRRKIILGNSLNSSKSMWPKRSSTRISILCCPISDFNRYEKSWFQKRCLC